MKKSESPQDIPESKNETVSSDAAKGFEGSAERDAKSRQVIGEHSREIERQIGERMPDRK